MCRLLTALSSAGGARSPRKTAGFCSRTPSTRSRDSGADAPTICRAPLPDGEGLAALRSMRTPVFQRRSRSGCSKRNDLVESDALVYAQFSRGAAPRATPFRPRTPPTVFAFARGRIRIHRRKAAARLVPDERWGRCNIKSVMLLRTFSRPAGAEAGAMDAILVRDGLALEGTKANLFLASGAASAPRQRPAHLPVSPRGGHRGGANAGDPRGRAVVHRRGDFAADQVSSPRRRCGLFVVEIAGGGSPTASRVRSPSAAGALSSEFHGGSSH